MYFLQFFLMTVFFKIVVFYGENFPRRMNKDLFVFACCFFKTDKILLSHVEIEYEVNEILLSFFYHGPDVSLAMVMWPPCWNVTKRASHKKNSA